MSIKSRVLGLAAVAAISLSFAVPAMALDPNASDTASVTVTLTDSGTFAVDIIGATLSSVDSSVGGDSTGSLCLQYTDTKTYRGQFHTKLTASDFTSTTLVQRPGRPFAGQPYKIAASRLEITRSFDVFEGRWSSWAEANLGYSIGDIGASSNGLDDDYSSGPYAGGPIAAAGCGFGPINGVSNHDWSSAVSRDLSAATNPIVGFGFAGPGTAGPFAPTYGSLHLLYVKLAVPAGQPADVYTSTLTVTVTFTGP